MDTTAPKTSFKAQMHHARERAILQTACDLLGTNTGHYPRHSRRYADLAAEEARLQAMRVQAFRDFADDVRGGGYPQRGHEIHVGEEIRAALDGVR